MDNILTLTHATERDIDLLLVEELKCSPDFVRWLTNKIGSITGRSISLCVSEVTHSKRRTYNRREIDICLALKPSNGLPTYLLIENKLDTSEQFEQAESYRAEADLLVQRQPGPRRLYCHSLSSCVLCAESKICVEIR